VPCHTQTKTDRENERPKTVSDPATSAPDGVAMDPHPPLSALTSDQLMERARQYRRMAASATTAEIRDAINVLAIRFAMLAARRTDACDDSVC
jgi:hypothetical protein